ncbi:MAG: polyphosphate polymerase domain-containing protein [Chitinophagaceae bacterium]|nr:polyphosphate polymerase domain-containing protein [Chitinophagaceae bacterium]
MQENNVISLVDGLQPISLDEMDGVRLQNRVDTKYVIPVTKLPKVFGYLQGRYSVLEIAGKRVFNYFTTYFDTEDYQFYKDHHNRLSGRIKARSRSYVESNLHFFEIKVKNNYRTKKFREQLDTQLLELSPKQRKKINSFYRKIRPFYHKDVMGLLAPTLYNRYTRITLVNSNKTERCTIDLDMSFQDPENPEKKISQEEFAIIELKQSRSSTVEGVAWWLRQMGVHPMGISKYVLGLIRIHPEIKHNSFKPLILNLDRLAQQ